MNLDDILAVKIHSDDFDSDLTIKGYLKELLTALWCEGESFSGKRPFGNSGWEFDLYKPLVACGAVEGAVDEDGYLEKVDRVKANGLVFELINHCFSDD